MFSITVAKTKIQKIRQKLSIVEKDVKNQRTLLNCWWENELVQNHVEKLSGKFLVKQTNVYDSAIPVLHLHGPKKSVHVFTKKCAQ